MTASVLADSPSADAFGSGEASRRITLLAGGSGPLPDLQPALALPVYAVEIPTPVGPLPLSLRAAGALSAFPPAPPVLPESFRPPALFSAPLPTGSGARALGFAGGFTAVADDATAASWNPAGLLQLERPEVSAVYRHQWTANRHHSDDPDFQVGRDDYDSGGLNYLSAAYPFLIGPLHRNAVISLNYQEAYDFTQSFHATLADRSSERRSSARAAVFRDRQVDRLLFEGGALTVDIASEIITRSTSRLDVRAETELAARLDFDQQGVIDALTPAFALEITPTLYLGGAVNFYQNGLWPDQDLTARSRTTYQGRSTTISTATTTLETTGSFRTSATLDSPGLSPFLAPFQMPLGETSGNYPVFRERQVRTSRATRWVEGWVEQVDRYRNLDGINSTLGLMWTVNRFLVLAGAVDLGWTAEATQTRTVTRVERVRDQPSGPVRAETRQLEAETRAVEMEFPLFWTAGAVLRLSPLWYTSLDVSHTAWSDFAYDVEGVGRINPFDGTPHGENPVDDTWSVRLGTEFLHLTRWADLPLRAGLLYEERPGWAGVDPYHGFSLGSGLALGEEGRRWIFDFAYQFLTADGVRSLAGPTRSLKTDTDQHLFFVSLIKHF
jgi:hypothetical protein